MKIGTVTRTSVLATLIVFASTLSPTLASASEDVLEFKKGDTILISTCVPANARPPIQLYSLTKKKAITTFGTKTAWSGPAPRANKKWCSSGLLFSRYIAANFTGDQEIAFYLPSTKKYYASSPSKLVEIKLYQGNPDDLLLDQPAVNFFRYRPGQSTLVNVMEVNLGSSTSPESLRSVSDQIYAFLCRRYNTKITSNDIDVLFNPSGWANNLLREQIYGEGESWMVLVRRLKFNAG